MINKRILAELKAIAASNNGVLRPKDVVEQARNPRNPLHNQFDWNNTTAAASWRLHQARVLIRVTVEHLHPANPETYVRTFVSLKPDRELVGGGYRSMVEVLSDKDMRAQLLQDAMEDLEVFEIKYAKLDELAGVFAASHSLRAKYRPKTTARKAKISRRKTA